mgnify:CR=1 FL=1
MFDHVFSLWIGIKKLMTLVEMAKQAEGVEAFKFFSLLEDERAIEYGTDLMDDVFGSSLK